MFTKARLGVFILALVFVAIPMESVMAGPTLSPKGVWTCTVVRSGTVERPIMYTFNADGTFNYSSGTTINSLSAGPVQNSGFHSRGGGRGQWVQISNNAVNYKSIEFLYDANGNLAGSFAVDSDLLVTSTGQLCGGRSECPLQTASMSLVKYQFDGNDVDADVVGLQYLLPLGTPANVLCNSLSSGAGFPGIPVPLP